ncbi:pyridine nucleotide-disulfide oxidoreductase domain-containing protein 1 [Aplysia californica]|uniref:Pyridine nucleotide-disulfide oxidoreductase domain-containing protein 1 n=1 Tax=Aplysia californica TaxID=6500 RepID=A0ABM0JD09_APLCA|nr:pyridine nucleotide-disulfide oxidoreductase domain-containing protein 1 [Aplysia californica]XP_005090886.1 pyridine nucleotide-disulfide oxidoreductase domain-containing protein 1 [Aplysia californica]
MTSGQYIVIGGGIAGVSCVEALSYLDKDAKITLISASPLIKTVTNYVQLTQVAETFDVEEKPLSHAEENRDNVTVMQAVVESLNTQDKTLVTSDGQTVSYDKLCVCTGGKPKVIASDSPVVVGIRDTESVKDFQVKMKTARRIVIIGNGGIATELVYELEGCEVIWAIKDKSIAHTFVDAGAGEFFMEHLNKEKDKSPDGPSKRLKYTTQESQISNAGVMGGALGPDWATNVDMHGSQNISHRVHVEHQVEVRQILSQDDLDRLQASGEKQSLSPEGWTDHPSWPAYVELTNGKIYGCDLVVSATGVVPFTDTVLPGNHFELASDGGLRVNDKMETSQPHVFAAGDVCTACWEHSPHWLQMRLWTQARQMGCYAAKCMVASHSGEDVVMDFCFELFAHVTTFFRFKVVLLGKFNAQGLGDDFEILLRVSKGEEYVKAILQNGRLMGAILIGETDLEETFENLILNAIDLTPFKDNLLEPGIDIEDFFD